MLIRGSSSAFGRQLDTALKASSLIPRFSLCRVDCALLLNVRVFADGIRVDRSALHSTLLLFAAQALNSTGLDLIVDSLLGSGLLLCVSPLSITSDLAVFLQRSSRRSIA